MVLYAMLHWNAEVDYASVDAAAHAKIAGTPGAGGRAPFPP
jgi:hypothetical protein